MQGVSVTVSEMRTDQLNKSREIWTPNVEYETNTKKARMREVNELSTFSPKAKYQKEHPENRVRKSLEEELIKEMEWKEDPCFTFCLILLVLHHGFILISYNFLLRVTSCPVESPFTANWIYHSGSLLGLIFAWIIDKGTNKLDFALICSTFIFILTTLAGILIIFDDDNSTLFCTMAHIVFAFVDASMGSTFALMLEQLKYLTFSISTDYMLFISVWGCYFLSSVITIAYQFIIYFYGNLPFYYVVAFLSIFCCFNKIIILLVISRRVFRPTTILNLPYMVILYIILKFKSYCKMVTLRKITTQPLPIPLAVVTICEQFTKVSGIILFSIPFGISSLVATKAWENAWSFREDRLNYTRNFTAFYNFSSTLLFPVYFFGMYIQRAKCKCLATELRQMGFGHGIVIMSLLCITLMNIRIEQRQFPLPTDGYAQIRFFNLLDTATTIEFRYVKGQVAPYGLATFSRIKMDGSIMNTAIQLTNEKYGISVKTSVVGTNGKSLCYYINQKQLGFIGEEPFNRKTNKSERRTNIVYFITDFEDYSLRIENDKQHAWLFHINHDKTKHKLLYTKFEKGQYTIFFKYGYHWVNLGSVTFDEASYYAILFTNSTSEVIYRFFTIQTPRFAPFTGMVMSAALLGLGNSIVLYSAVKFLLNECSPLLHTSVMAISYVCQHLVYFIFSFNNLQHVLGQSTNFYLSLTSSLIFLILYIYAAMTYKYLPYSRFGIEPSPPRSSPVKQQSSTIIESGSKDTLSLYR